MKKCQRVKDQSGVQLVTLILRLINFLWQILKKSLSAKHVATEKKKKVNFLLTQFHSPSIMSYNYSSISSLKNSSYTGNRKNMGLMLQKK